MDLSLTGIKNWLTGPTVLRFLFGVLRRHRPVLVLGKRAVVTRHDDVVDVLTRDGDFTIRQINGAKMEQMLVPFYLGMDRSPQHDRELAMVMQVIRREDLDRIRDFARAQAASIVEAVRPKGRIELVNELTRIVPLRLVDHYFGVPGPPEKMKWWMRILFWQIFLNNDDQKILEQGKQASAELKEHMDALIAERKRELVAGKDIGDSVLARMLRLQATGTLPWLDDDAVRRNVCGQILGAVDTTNKVVTQAIDVLLDRPDQLRAAAAAAGAGDIERVKGYIFEALRFNPHNPVIVRYCESAQRVGARNGNGGGHVIPAGTTVYAATLSAMFDPAAFADPASFIPDRKVEYLHFGHGLHACTGRYINGVQIPEIAAALLRLKNLRRSSRDGEIAWQGVFPERLMLEFDPE